LLGIKYANELSQRVNRLSKEREDQAQKNPRQKRDNHFRYCATMGNTAETVLGRWTSSMYTPTNLNNRIYKK